MLFTGILKHSMLFTGIFNWCDTKGCLLVLLLLLLLIKTWKKRNSLNVPPGPWVIPLSQDVLIGIDHHAINKVMLSSIALIVLYHHAINKGMNHLLFSLVLSSPYK